jgi:hypothetical protein
MPPSGVSSIRIMVGWRATHAATATLMPDAAKAPTSIARNQARPAFPLKDPHPGSSLKTWFSLGSVSSGTNVPPPERLGRVHLPDQSHNSRISFFLGVE